MSRSPVPDEGSFWLKAMSECLEGPAPKLRPGKRLLVLGDDDSGKAALLSRLQGGAQSQGHGLEFRHLSVKDEEGDNQTRLGIWSLDGHPFYRPLLGHALSKDSLADTTVLIAVTMTRPWDIPESLESWTTTLEEHIAGLGLTEEELETHRGRVLDRFREYVEPGLSIYGSLAADSTRTLEVNLGLELVVVVTHTEYMRDLRAEFGYEEEHLDFLQRFLREFCLARGAALFYVSVREDRNCDFLLKYLLHKIYAFPFRIPGVLVEPEAVLVPAGWDTPTKIRFLSAIPPDTPFEDVIFKPARLHEAKHLQPEVVAQRDQEFLADLQVAMDRPLEVVRDEVSSATATVVQRNVARRMSRPKKSVEMVEGDSNTLSNFFHSLLNRRTSAPVDGPLGLSGNRGFQPRLDANPADEDISTNRDKDSRMRHHLSLERDHLPQYFVRDDKRQLEEGTNGNGVPDPDPNLSG